MKKKQNLNNRYKTRQPIGNTLDLQIYLKLKKYSEETKIPMSKILDMAVESYLEKVNFY